MNMCPITRLLLASVTLLMVSGMTIAGESDLQVWVEIDAGDGRLTVQPMARASAPVAVSYHMVVTSKTAAGRSHTRQQGAVEVGRDATILSMVQVGIAEGQRYIIELEATDGNGGHVEARRVHEPDV